jgi:hypothetical protein
LLKENPIFGSYVPFEVTPLHYSVLRLTFKYLMLLSTHATHPGEPQSSNRHYKYCASCYSFTLLRISPFRLPKVQTSSVAS